MVTKKLASTIIRSLLISVVLTSCGGNGTNTNQEYKTTTYIINHSGDKGKYGNGIYVNTNAERTCPHCGMRVSVDNIFHDCQNTKFSSSGNGNQYGEGYEQGQDDARRGLDSDPDGYGGNGQFRKGYKDGYEDW